MDGFKDSTKVKYMCGGMAGAPMKKAMGGSVKMPVKKAMGGKMPSPAESAASGNRMSAQEAREMREMLGSTMTERERREMTLGSTMTEREKREMKKRVPATRREPMLPPVGASAASGNRMSAQEGAEMREMTRRKMGGLAVMPKGK